MKKYQNEKTKTSAKVSTKGFKFKHTEVEEAYELSGYEFNEITPFFMGEGGEELPIILSQDIVDLEPAYLWLSGGTQRVKLGISVEDFLKWFGDRVIVANI